VRFVVSRNPFIVAAADTLMHRPSAESLAEVFRASRWCARSGSSARCWRSTGPRKVLGFEPRHSGRDHVPAEAAPASSASWAAGRALRERRATQTA